MANNTPSRRHPSTSFLFFFSNFPFSLFPSLFSQPPPYSSLSLNTFLFLQGQQRQGAISSVVSWTNNTFNPTHSTTNAARLAAVLGAYYLYKKKNEWEEEIEASSFLSEIPPLRSTVCYPPEAKEVL